MSVYVCFVEISVESLRSRKINWTPSLPVNVPTFAKVKKRRRGRKREREEKRETVRGVSSTDTIAMAHSRITNAAREPRGGQDDDGIWCGV